ncbi:aminotransferase class IV [Alistipes provencensis]|uniref:hypothetical protein n=1 Tax=Alistipes provencensis TaxID=1816676 RepID=UPI0007ED84C0|nr:hypothetical protein [Alistipes provencensis]
MTELYLYQTVHLARGHARNVEAHVAVLDAASRELFGRRYAPGAARLAGADIAVRCDREGILREADDAPLFAVTGHTVLAAPGAESVERALAVQAVRAAGLELREEPFGRGDLPQIDELFFADHRGITALARCDGQPLMTLVAERISSRLESGF